MKNDEKVIKSFRFYPRCPSLNGGKGARKSFGLLKRFTYEDGTEDHETIVREELKSINDQFHKGVIDHETAKKNIYALVKRLNREAGVLCGIDTFNNDNEKILEDYWNKKYRTRKLVDKRGSYTSILRAVRSLGNLSLLTASEDDLQNQINESREGNTQRTTVARINSLLKHIRRDLELKKFKPEYPDVKFFTEEEFSHLMGFIKHEGLKALSQVTFHTGMREAEALAGPQNIYRLEENLPQVFVHKQLRAPRKQMDGTISGKAVSVPKSKKRWAYVFEEGVDVIQEWLRIYNDFELSHSYASKLLKEASIKAFPNNPDKWMAFNGLRHSYAKRLFNIGLSMGHVAQHLGNTESVCEKHYVGWQHTEQSMMMTHLMVQQSKRKSK